MRFSDQLLTGNQSLQCKQVVDQSTMSEKIVDIKYDKTKGNLELDSYAQSNVSENNYDYYAVKYVENNKLLIARTLKEAILRRANKEDCLTIREADTLARSNTDIRNAFFRTALFEFSAFVVEDDIYTPNNAFILRSRYNKGLHWKKFIRHKSSLVEKDKGDALILNIQVALVEKGFGPYIEEIELGFPEELLRPEYLTAEHFQQLTKHLQLKRTIK